MIVMLSLIAGGMSAGLYFGGLWWTIQRLAGAHHPTAIYLGSLIVRVACLLGVVWLAIQLGQPGAVVAFFAGFLLMRAFVVRRFAVSASQVSES